MENYEEEEDYGYPFNKYRDDDEDEGDTQSGSYKSSGKSSKTPALDTYSRDLTAMASRGELDPIIGRDEEIERVSQILCRRKNGPHPSRQQPSTSRRPRRRPICSRTVATTLHASAWRSSVFTFWTSRCKTTS